MKKPILLLVEDSEDDAFFFERTIKQAQIEYMFHRVSHGEEAVDFLSKIQDEDAFPKVIFLDLKMPVMNGFEFLNWMQNQALQIKIPVVVLSGSEQDEDKERASKLGAAEFLVKPLTNLGLEKILKLIAKKTGESFDGDLGHPL